MARSSGGLDKQRFARGQETFHINFRAKSEEREISTEWLIEIDFYHESPFGDFFLLLYPK